jgi:hypothetical protein
MTVTEYLEQLWHAGVAEDDLPAAQPLFHQRIWNRLGDDDGGGGGPERLEQLLVDLRREDPAFHVEGGSWTSYISWERGYEQLLGPMQSASAAFAQAVASGAIVEGTPGHREALFHLLLSQTSCFRYWGEGEWADYGREFCRRATAALNPPG